MGLLPYLSGMADMLVPKVQDTQPMVRIISCWALMRYAYWLLAGGCHAWAVLADDLRLVALPVRTCRGCLAGYLRLHLVRPLLASR